ncbi:MAG: hypothetical protein ACLFPD_02840 [Desulfosudaceae bacterium]
MKTGIILYFPGNQSLPADAAALGRAAQALIPDADQVEIVGRDQGHWDISDAWRSLTCQGMHRILVRTAGYSARQGLQLEGREMRLSG